MVDHPNDQNHEELGFLQEFVEIVREDAPPEEWCQASRRQLQDSLETPKEESWIMKLMSHKRQGKLRWALALPIAALIILAVIFGIPGLRGNNSNAAFARVARQLRTARTLAYTVTTRMPGMPEMKMDTVFKEPGLMRMSMGTMVVSIGDYNKNKMVTINSMTREFTEIDLKNVPQGASQRLSDQIKWLRNIPMQVSEDLGTKDSGGRTVHGYRIAREYMNGVAWLDAHSGALDSIEMDISKTMPGAQAIMSDFKFDVPYDDSLFSMAMPSGFHRSRMDMDDSKPDEKSLIDSLRIMASMYGEGSFPPSLNPVDLNKAALNNSFLKGFQAAKAAAQKRQHAKTASPKQQPDKQMTRDEEKKKAMEDTITMTKGLMFQMQMKPENDWHYAGQGIKFGDASQPVCWWKPTGSKTYKVILGDLSIIDVDLGQTPTGNKITLPKK